MRPEKQLPQTEESPTTSNIEVIITPAPEAPAPSMTSLIVTSSGLYHKKSSTLTVPPQKFGSFRCG